jgi:nitrite reductase (NADH) small subunit
MTTVIADNHPTVALIEVCAVSDLIMNSGVCALIDDRQVAIFAIQTPSEAQTQGEFTLYAVSNWDPIGKANVMYRGLLGSMQQQAMICSPLYKQHYSLLTGQCFEDDTICLEVYECVVADNKVWVSAA